MLVSQHDRRPVVPGASYAQYSGCRFLIDDYAIAVLPAAAFVTLPAASQSREHRDGDGGIAVVGHGLPGAIAEARAIATPPRDAVLVGPGEGAVRAAMAGCGRLHLATHAELDTARPSFARLQLAADDEHDGWLCAWEIADERLRGAPLVVLSGCDTLGHAGSADGVFGLARAFLAAGASGVIATFWPVADEASTELMADFHAAANGPAVDNLRATQLRLRNRRVHPYFWAGYTLYGGFRE
jgi:CHAT domain-containing protein